ncbi:MAG: helix-turn-helix transcriptional regulator [Clostridiales bacterium]|nr:helix-turn-helix transcriptional regulator [Clostridiales bacterium]MCD8109024.1 helix-turn-helix transcriptional regulator [Clostridiales bacterium]
METVNPYHFVTNCISGKWKMTILHHIHHYGKIRFNETKKTLGVSEKVLSQQLKELAKDGLVERIQYNTIPLKVEYILTPLGKDLIPALDILYVWSIRRLNELNLPIDPDAFKVHDEMKYQDQLMDIMDSYMKNQNQLDE